LQSRPARLWWLAEPLCFLGASSEASGYAAHKRGEPLAPADVPEPLQRLDDVLALTSEERAALTGLLEQGPGAEGLAGLVRCTPGRSFQVWKAPKVRSVWLVVAGHLGERPHSLAWRAFVALRRSSGDPVTVRRAPHLEAQLEALLEGYLYTSSSELAHRAGLTPVSMSAGRADIPVTAEAKDLVRLLGSADKPASTWASLPSEDDSSWQRWIRVRALPASTAASVEALLALLGRRKEALRSSLSRAVDAAWSDLAAFWALPYLQRPDDAEVRRRLWERHDMRGMLCAHRLERDLVDPYAHPAGGAQ
jgi:hypothetical protein